ncbi:MAG: beta-propeller fold lactonase family protein, partial [Anaerolineae bacterium]|nr:beta-propeller fold lactonase family protein [Anaerolineae bacterium]
MAGKTVLYIGAYTQSPEQGVVVYEFDEQDGALTYRSTASGAANPSFLALHPTGKYLYAVNEVTSFESVRSGAITAYAVDPETGDLTYLNQRPSWGTAPCHVSVDGTGKMIYLANYSSGSIAAYPIEENGMLAPASAKVQHTGSG